MSPAELLAELAAEREGFDPTYQWSDDYGHWAQQAAKAGRLALIRKQLAEVAQ